MSQLPRLPVPDLDETLDLLLETLKPLARSSDELDRVRQQAAKFAKQGGVELQNALEERNRGLSGEYPEGTWVEEWWERYAYLMGRTPLIGYSNVFGTMFECQPCDDRVLRATDVMRALGHFLLVLERGELETERMGRMPLCMFQYTRLFATTRLPGLQEDSLETFAGSRHVVVSLGGHLFSVDVLSADRTRLLPREQVYSALLGIIEAAATLESGPGVAAFTSGSRVPWSKARARMRQNDTNAASLDVVESALFVLSLPEATPTAPSDIMHNCSVGSCPHDAWMDKSINVFVYRNGVTAFNFEHCASDAPVPARMISDLYPHINALPPLGTTRVTAQKPLPWVVDASTASSLAIAVEEARSLASDHVVSCLHFKGHGKTLLRSLKLPPDSYFQMALQLAYYRYLGHVTPTYESASLRGFWHGRTDTIRSLSNESVAWVKGMDTDVSASHKLALLQEATSSHFRYTKRTMSGRGIDRHLFGLQIIAASQGEAPGLFEDTLVKRGTEWGLSTSQMAFVTVDFPGFGAPSDDALGCCYILYADQFVANCSSNKRGPSGKDATKFCVYLEQALADMHVLLLSHPGNANL